MVSIYLRIFTNELDFFNSGLITKNLVGTISSIGPHVPLLVSVPSDDTIKTTVPRLCRTVMIKHSLAEGCDPSF